MLGAIVWRAKDAKMRKKCMKSKNTNYQFVDFSYICLME